MMTGVDATHVREVVLHARAHRRIRPDVQEDEVHAADVARVEDAVALVVECRRPSSDAPACDHPVVDLDERRLVGRRAHRLVEADGVRRFVIARHDEERRRGARAVPQRERRRCSPRRTATTTPMPAESTSWSVCSSRLAMSPASTTKSTPPIRRPRSGHRLREALVRRSY